MVSPKRFFKVKLHAYIYSEIVKNAKGHYFSLSLSRSFRCYALSWARLFAGDTRLTRAADVKSIPLCTQTHKPTTYYRAQCDPSHGCIMNCRSSLLVVETVVVVVVAVSAGVVNMLVALVYDGRIVQPSVVGFDDCTSSSNDAISNRIIQLVVPRRPANIHGNVKFQLILVYC